MERDRKTLKGLAFTSLASERPNQEGAVCTNPRIIPLERPRSLVSGVWAPTLARLAMAEILGEVVTNTAAKCQPLPLLTRIPPAPDGLSFRLHIDTHYPPASLPSLR